MSTDEEEALEWYKLNEGSHSFRGMRVKKGGRILLTSKEAEKLGERASRVVVVAGSSLLNPPFVVPPIVVVPRDWSTSQNTKAADVIAQVNETSSVEDLEALYDIEEKGQNRVTVLREIEKRVAQLEGEGK